mmetsp:Transcript_7570/g.31484  ORF Transcript_7570/g.31484 Transcript_7570/m.31484 type:complete len:211 (+) Transcript_7570:3114-3746(+)
MRPRRRAQCASRRSPPPRRPRCRAATGTPPASLCAVPAFGSSAREAREAWGGARSAARTCVPRRARPRTTASCRARRTRRPRPTATRTKAKAKAPTPSSSRSCAVRAVCACRPKIWWMSARCATRARTARGSRCGTSAPSARTSSASRTPCGGTSRAPSDSETSRGRATGDAATLRFGASSPKTRDWCPPRTRPRPGAPRTRGWRGSGGR